MNPTSPVHQWQQPRQPAVMPSKSQQSNYQSGPPPRQPQQRHHAQQIQSQSRGRSRQQEIMYTPPSARDESTSHSNFNTPRRKGNPQSPQTRTPQAHTDSLEVAKSRSRSNSSARMPDGNVDLSTPLATLSTILTTTKRYHSCATKNYRVNHQLFRDANDRTTKGAIY